jgi:hypothetical protein
MTRPIEEIDLSRMFPLRKAVTWASTMLHLIGIYVALGLQVSHDASRLMRLPALCDEESHG